MTVGKCFALFDNHGPVRSRHRAKALCALTLAGPIGMFGSAYVRPEHEFLLQLTDVLILTFAFPRMHRGSFFFGVKMFFQQAQSFILFTLIFHILYIIIEVIIVIRDLLLCLFAAIGAVAVFTELFRLLGRRRLRFTCLLFGDEAKAEWDAKNYGIVFLCRSELQEEELIRRLSEKEKRKIYIRRW